MGEITFTGGARIGLINASWPLAKLSASPMRLRLKCFFDCYDFEPRDVVSLERYGAIPIFYNGVRLVHARPDYPRRIIFWCFGNPEQVIEKIGEAGFLPTAPASSEVRWRGIPIRWAAILIFIAIWNGLFLLMGSPRSPHEKPGAFVLAPLLFAFLVCWGVKRSPDLQKIVLSDGHSVNEVKGFLSLIQTVTGLLLIVFVIILCAGGFS